MRWKGPQESFNGFLSKAFKSTPYDLTVFKNTINFYEAILCSLLGWCWNVVSKVNIWMNTSISKSVVSTVDHWPSTVLAKYAVCWLQPIKVESWWGGVRMEADSELLISLRRWLWRTLKNRWTRFNKCHYLLSIYSVPNSILESRHTTKNTINKVLTFWRFFWGGN